MARKRNRRTRGAEHRPRVRLSGGGFLLGPRSPWKGKVHRVNPYTLSEVGMLMNPRHRRRHHRHSYRLNPGPVANVQALIRRPGATLMDGLIGTVSAYMTIALPNWLLPFPGTDLMSKVLRLVTRAAAGGLVVLVVPRGTRQAALAGAGIGAVGSTILDFFGTRLIVGTGDTGQLPLALLAPITGVGTYGRPMLNAARGTAAYARPMVRGVGAPPAFPGRGIVKHNLF